MTTNFTRNLDGFVPASVLVDLAARNPNIASFLKSVSLTQQLWCGSAARTGQIFRFANTDKQGERTIYDAQNGTTRPGKVVRTEGSSPVKDAIVNDGYDFHGIVRDYYRTVHGRNSIDANGMAIKGIVHYDQDYNNAYWDGQYMTYGDGDHSLFTTFMLLNVAAHELTHGVTEYAVPGGVEYFGQSGAINEHFSDVGGANVESWKMGVDAMTYHWLVGKGIWAPAPAGSSAVRRGLRDMLNPGTAYNDPKLGRDRQPADMDHYVRTSSDNGGVHTNSGIPNKAYATFARLIQQNLGGNDWASTIGIAADVWYAARPNVGNNPSFAQLAYWTIQACAVRPELEAKLRPLCQQAWAAVKVTPDQHAIDTLTPAPDGDDNGAES